ncbi:MAG: single-stranded-DNA-specific exonuclease RecJ [Pseudomonadota bacterium]
MTADSFLFDVSNSLGGRFWKLKPVDEQKTQALAIQLGGNDLVARLLADRGIDPNEIEGFLDPTLKHTFPDPSSFADMDKAAELTLEALQAGKSVTVFADYDVDGGTSAAILTRYFRAWGQELGLYVPDRLTEGYGPSPEAFETLKAQGADLVITVDCGAAARTALGKAIDINLPVIVLDHHLMHGDIPPAAAIVNPNRPDCSSGCGHLAGVGVVFVFVAAINRLARQKGIAPPNGLPNPMQWLDLCALGTLCDMAPLKGVNRAFSRQGLKIMSKDNNPGLRALADVAGIGKIETVYHATFMLGPRLNAGGRIGDPWLASKLLSTDDWNDAVALAERLHSLNSDRKAVEDAMLERAVAQAEATIERDPATASLVISGEGWHPGVIGIVAGRLKDRFHLPSVVIGYGEGLGDVAKGSARSVKGINIGDAIADAAKSGIIMSGGGHAMAGGLSAEVEQIDGFRDWLNNRLQTQADTVREARLLQIDSLLGAGQASVDLVDQIDRIGPFGAGAPRPVFCLSDVTITGARDIGQGGHRKIEVEDATGRLEAIAWRCADTPLGDALQRGQRMHLVGDLRTNDWNGRRSVQFEIRDGTICS